MEGEVMIGAILGDIVGSPYEFDRGKKLKSHLNRFEKMTFYVEIGTQVPIKNAFNRTKDI